MPVDRRLPQHLPVSTPTITSDKVVCDWSDPPGFVYLLRSPSGRIYVGQTRRPLRERIKDHVEHARYRHASTPLHRAIRKYGIDSFIVDVLERPAIRQLGDREMYWIAKLNATDPTIGYNLTAGGEGGEMVAEVRERISRSKSGVRLGPYTAERRAAISAGKIASGYRHSDKARDRIKSGRAHYRKLTPEHRRSIAAGLNATKSFTLGLPQLEEVVELIRDGLGDGAVAERLGVSRKMIWRIRHGKYQRPEASHLLAKLYGPLHD